MKYIVIPLIILSSFGFGFLIKSETTQKQNKSLKQNKAMKLGAFSISLSVKNLEKSIAYYEKFGFTKLGGDIKQNYVILKNENAIIGLFQGMFEGNIITFNPGWDENAKEVNPFDDIRFIQKHLIENGIKIDTKIDESSTGPASLMLEDPDGNVILIDQHR